MADYGLLGGIGEGLKAGLQGYMDMRSMTEKRQQAALEAAMKQRQMDIMEQHYNNELDIAGFETLPDGTIGPVNLAKKRYEAPDQFQPKTDPVDPAVLAKDAWAAKVMPTNPPAGLLADKLDQGGGLLRNQARPMGAQATAPTPKPASPSPMGAPSPSPTMSPTPKPGGELDQDSSTPQADYSNPLFRQQAEKEKQAEAQQNTTRGLRSVKEIAADWNDERELNRVIDEQNQALQSFRQMHPNAKRWFPFASPQEVLGLRKMYVSMGLDPYIIPATVEEKVYKGMVGGAFGAPGIYSQAMAKNDTSSNESLLKDQQFLAERGKMRDKLGNIIGIPIDATTMDAYRTAYKSIGGKPEALRDGMTEDVLRIVAPQLFGNQRALNVEEAKPKKGTGGGAKSPIEGFAPNSFYKANSTNDRTLMTVASDVKDFNNQMNDLVAKLRAASTTDLLNPFSSTNRDIKNSLRSIQLTYKSKAFADLGVLNGKDLSVLEDIIENPSKLQNLSNKDAVIQRYEEAKNRINRKMIDTFQVHGLTPTTWKFPQGSGEQGNAGKPTGGLIGNRDAEAVTWAKKNPNDPKAAKILKLNGF